MKKVWVWFVPIALALAVTTAKADMAAALKAAGKQNKHLFALFVRQGDPQGTAMERVFAEAERTLGKRALFRTAKVTDLAEVDFVSKYGIDRAPMPLTVVFAPNGAIVNSFPGMVVTKDELGNAFAAPAFADVMKALQDGKVVLLCVQGKRTQNNGPSLAAARSATYDQRAKGTIAVVQAAPEDAVNANMLKPLKADSTLKVATIFILVPPSTLAGKVEGATTHEELWTAITKGVSACSGGSGCCGPK
jgi:hypothetical protein